jgi:rare lipoprotein A
MKKLAIIATLFLLSTQTASACDNWPSCAFSNKPEVVETKSNKAKKTKTTRAPSIRDIPVIGDVVRGFEQGLASFYWQPQAVACGGRFNPEAMTAAHKILPCGTKVKVTNKRNGRSVVVTINDRGPYVAGRIIDLSRAAARTIDMTGAGVVPVSLERF